ncbi:UDP-galactose/UDP-N-acetylglucosamine transporter srf-3 [Parelaphostrongylus tenuis]|uniref:UDP-galactose/UDP-N-acetylglucosamine transporter srf-3 n=1 Tax=Parelaphostrongylus tenuis TaxID=148309 RepID=A0AAD5QH35_PARTN|nr:UDP-galactose/UDP-N-acetylglucosamine transporter srf-3 [Parelaphostrongylus tenuis]
MATTDDKDEVVSGDVPLLHSARRSAFPAANIKISHESAQATGNMRTAVLVWLTLQNSIHTLLIRYSRSRQVEHMFLSTVAVFFTEVAKLLVCLGFVLQDETPQRFFPTIMDQVVRQPYDTLKVCIPAMVYMVQNNLYYVAASHLDAATFMIASQLKIFTAAIFTVIMLHRFLTRTQWFALLILFIGVSLVQLQSSKSESSRLGGQDPLIGFVAVVIACCLSGFAGIYFEKILKGSAPVSLWMRNIQMCVFAIPSSFVAVIWQDGKVVAKEGLLYGFDWVVWLTVIWYCIGGLSVAVCIKYADNIAKNFATSVAIILATIGSIIFFSFQPTAQFLLGATLVIFSIFMYSSSQSMLRIFRRWMKTDLFS